MLQPTSEASLSAQVPPLRRVGEHKRDALRSRPEWYQFNWQEARGTAVSGGALPPRPGAWCCSSLSDPWRRHRRGERSKLDVFYRGPNNHLWRRAGWPDKPGSQWRTGAATDLQEGKRPRSAPAAASSGSAYTRRCLPRSQRPPLGTELVARQATGSELVAVHRPTRLGWRGAHAGAWQRRLVARSTLDACSIAARIITFGQAGGQTSRAASGGVQPPTWEAKRSLPPWQRAANAGDKIDVFYSGTNGHLWERAWWPDTPGSQWWSGAADLGGVALTSGSRGSRRPGRTRSTCFIAARTTTCGRVGGQTSLGWTLQTGRPAPRPATYDLVTSL